MEQVIRFTRPPRRIQLVDAGTPLADVVGRDATAPGGDAAQHVGGRSDKLDEDEVRLGQVLAEVCELLTVTRRQQEETFREIQLCVVDLAVEIASRVLHEKINSNDLAIERIVQETLAQLAPERPLAVRLHPEDLELLHLRLDDTPLATEDEGEIPWRPDDSLARGDCQVDGAEFGILHQLQVHLSNIHQNLVDSVENAWTRDSGT